MAHSAAPKWCHFRSAELVRKLRFQSDPKLASRTVRNIYTVVKAMFRDAALDESAQLENTPCIVNGERLGRVVDKDREWRAGAFFSRDEAEIMISHADIPHDRRVAYALGLLTGMRRARSARCVGATTIRTLPTRATRVAPSGRPCAARSGSSGSTV